MDIADLNNIIMNKQDLTCTEICCSLKDEICDNIFVLQILNNPFDRLYTEYNNGNIIYKL